MGARVAAVVLAFLALAGCAGQGGGMGGGQPPKMTVSDFYGFCSSLPTPNACLSDPICNRYRQELSEAPAELSACLAMCRKTSDALYTDNLINGCGGVLDRASDLCDQFCRRHDPS